jgi:UPF0755 protein
MKKISSVFLAILAVIGLAALMAGFYLLWLFQPVAPSSQEEIRFVVPRGQAITIIGQRLQEAGLIKNPLVFRYIVQQDDLANKIQAGSFSLSPSMSSTEIAHALTEGTNDLWVTVLEGWRAEEIGQMLADEEELVVFDQTEFLNLARAEDGYLFPDTYLVPRAATAEDIYNLLRDTFDQKVRVGLADEIAQSGQDLRQVIILASLLEREAQGLTDMRHVAGILQNRLDLGMALQVDATLQYVKGYNQAQQNWWVPPTAADKQLDSPFNTYLHPGLPPRPISNPGLEAIQAALDPLATDDLFYIHDNQGTIRYAEDLEGHNANVNRYLR